MKRSALEPGHELVLTLEISLFEKLKICLSSVNYMIPKIFCFLKHFQLNYFLL